jgi:hypothetical protein
MRRRGRFLLLILNYKAYPHSQAVNPDEFTAAKCGPGRRKDQKKFLRLKDVRRTVNFELGSRRGNVPQQALSAPWAAAGFPRFAEVAAVGGSGLACFGVYVATIWNKKQDRLLHFRPSVQCRLMARMQSPGGVPSCRLVGSNRKRPANLPNGEFDPRRTLRLRGLVERAAPGSILGLFCGDVGSCSLSFKAALRDGMCRHLRESRMGQRGRSR